MQNNHGYLSYPVVDTTLNVLRISYILKQVAGQKMQRLSASAVVSLSI